MSTRWVSTYRFRVVFGVVLFLFLDCTSRDGDAYDIFAATYCVACSKESIKYGYKAWFKSLGDITLLETHGLHTIIRDFSTHEAGKTYTTAAGNILVIVIRVIQEAVHKNLAVSSNRLPIFSNTLAP